MLAKHVLSVGNGRQLQEVFLVNSFSLFLAMNSKEATRKLVGPSDWRRWGGAAPPPGTITSLGIDQID